MEQTAPEKIQCPHCGSSNCFVESNYAEITPEKISSYMCVGCGYSSTTLNTADSSMIAEYEAVTPQIMIDLKWIDPATNLVWYPTVLNFPSTGIIFPDGVDASDWSWRSAPAIDIPVEEQKNYPIPGKEGEFYTRRVDMPSSKLFPKEQFSEACEFIGLIQ